MIDYNPLVSVFMITYNHEKYISKALDSILSQIVNFRYEIVIGEDCSKDKTRQILLEYSNKFPAIINLILHEHNVGASQNQFITLNACRGKYIAICEGDDYWIDQYKLQKQIDFMELNPSYSLVYGKVSIFNNEKNRFLKVFFGKECGGVTGLIVNGNTIPTLTTLFRRDLYIEYINAGILKWKMGDFPLWIFLASKGDVFFMDEVFGVYRRSSGTASNPISTKARISFQKSYLDIRNYYAQQFEYPVEVCQKLKNDYLIVVARICLLNGYKKNILRRYLRIFFRARSFKEKIWNTVINNSFLRIFLFFWYKHTIS